MTERRPGLRKATVTAGDQAKRAGTAVCGGSRTHQEWRARGRFVSTVTGWDGVVQACKQAGAKLGPYSRVPADSTAGLAGANYGARTTCCAVHSWPWTCRFFVSSLLSKHPAPKTCRKPHGNYREDRGAASGIRSMFDSQDETEGLAVREGRRETRAKLPNVRCAWCMRSCMQTALWRVGVSTRKRACSVPEWKVMYFK